MTLDEAEDVLRSLDFPPGVVFMKNGSGGVLDVVDSQARYTLMRFGSTEDKLVKVTGLVNIRRATRTTLLLAVEEATEKLLQSRIEVPFTDEEQR